MQMSFRVTRRAQQSELSQLDSYKRDPAPRRAEIEALLRQLHANEEAAKHPA